MKKTYLNFVAGAIVLVLVIVSIITPPSQNVRGSFIHQRNENKDYIDKIISLHQQQQILEDTFDVGGIGRSIDLTLFVVFHKVLPVKHFDGIAWPQIAWIGPKKHARPAGEPNEDTMPTDEAVTILKNRECLNRTSVIFIATNKEIEHKKYDAAMVQNRLLLEWEMPGFDPTTIQSSMNEYGAMSSVFRSKVTQNAGKYNASGHELITADADGDGVQEWIGFFQYDMRLDQKLLNKIRRRIIQKTATKSAIQLRNRMHQQRHLLCCIFYGVSYPTSFLLMNSLGVQLLVEYNKHFGTRKKLSDLPAQVIVDAFVMPTVLFNHIMPFLTAVMHRAVGNLTFYPAVKGTDDSGMVGAGVNANPLDVAEAALALALGFQSMDFIVVQMPLRHEKVI